MPTNRAEIVINADPQKVFDHLDTPETHFAVAPSLTEMGHVEKKSGGGHDVEFTMRIHGVPLRGVVRIAEHDPPNRIGWNMEGELTYTLEREGGATKVTYVAEYANPMPVLKSVADPLISRYNQREVMSTLANLKDRVEAI